MLKGSCCIIRADGSTRLGMGHFTRSLALAEGLESWGLVPRFLCREAPEGALSWLTRSDYAVETFPANTTFAEDLAYTREHINRHKASWVITDLCNIDTLDDIDGYQSYLGGLKDTGVSLLTVDDLNQLPFPSNIVLNPNYGANELPYETRPDTQYLLGPSYFPFRREFRQVAGQPRKIRDTVSRVLVTLGGSDYQRSVPKLLRALDQVDRSNQLEVRLAGGLSTEVDEETDRMMARLGDRCSRLAPGSTLLDSLLWCDIAITAGGLTKYETALTGTPSLIISQVDHQDYLTRRFVSEGSCWYLGSGSKITEDTVVEGLVPLIKDYDARVGMSEAGKMLVDGRGIDRIIDAIKNLYPVLAR